MYYPTKKDFAVIFRIIHEHLEGDEKPPQYEIEEKGLKRFRGITEMAKLGYYEGFFKKLTAIFVGINKGHFFSNGNKRLALVTALDFIFSNKYMIRRYSKDKYAAKIKETFPGFDKFKDYKDFSVEEFAFYNVAIIVADSQEYVESHDDLKGRVETFLRFATYK